MGAPSNYQLQGESAAAAMLARMGLGAHGGRCDGGWSSAELAAVAGVPPKQVASLLAGCVRAGWVRKEKSGNRLVWHLSVQPGGPSVAVAVDPARSVSREAAARRRAQREAAVEVRPVVCWVIDRIDGGTWTYPLAARSVFELGGSDHGAR